MRYDPFNIGIAYAYVKGQGIECTSQYYIDFQGHTEKELKLASSEIRNRDRNHTKNNKVSAKKLANFIASAEAQEALFQQRTRDFETQQVLQMIEGKVTPLTQYRDRIEVVEDQKPAIDSDESVIIEEPESEADLDWDELEIYEEF